jgi:hypothetical protein
MFAAGVRARCERRGDWVMRMRFWSEITREGRRCCVRRCTSRAFRPKARSHDPVTTPRECAYNATEKTQFRFKVGDRSAAGPDIDLPKMAARYPTFARSPDRQQWGVDFDDCGTGHRPGTAGQFDSRQRSLS